MHACKLFLILLGWLGAPRDPLRCAKLRIGLIFDEKPEFGSPIQEHSEFLEKLHPEVTGDITGQALFLTICGVRLYRTNICALWKCRWNGINRFWQIWQDPSKLDVICAKSSHPRSRALKCWTGNFGFCWCIACFYAYVYVCREEHENVLKHILV